MKKLVIAFVLLIGTGCAVEDEFADDQLAGEVLASDEGGTDDSQPPAFGVAIVAGGCFWGIEDKLKKVDGVIDTDVGYCGGTVPDVTYEMVSTGTTGHAESVKVLYNPSVITYERLIASFLRTHDPSVVHPLSGYGSQYRSAVFYLTEEEREDAMRAIAALDKSGLWDDPIVTQVVPAGQFWMAEEYHQDYYDK
ncbi:MAG TPA: peptide-methionine (S)-S-oxide reductase MsrA [Myxococcota bacterium]|nr:peptide-methionine (S)-S-oxide reductase MsrA [Myxococcota bacterium]HOC99818.1 peptide-methionine (S)-S-oxide reductase MsrA [Myxococcota bacterium]HOH76052.1 peptide-methionine (S)-S-oxide reductase MsrA [Myxococcota bacterium]